MTKVILNDYEMTKDSGDTVFFYVYFTPSREEKVLEKLAILQVFLCY